MATAPESHYVLDGILGNDTDLPVEEHATDTHGATLANFALFDLVGKQLSPRIRDLGKITLYRTGPKAAFAERYPHAGPLLTRRADTELITAAWDDLLRVAASVKYGHATAALVVGRLCSSKRQQNTLTSAIKEYGALRRTVYAARYLADETYRRRIARQLDKGENLHSLRRELAYAGEGAVRRRHHEQQTEQMWCLTLATNAIVTWTTEYYGLAIAALRRGGRPVDDDVLAHIWPTHHENVNFYRSHAIDLAGELTKLDSDGYTDGGGSAATAASGQAGAAQAAAFDAATRDDAAFNEQFRHEFADVDGVRMHYVTGGNGPPLVLLAGWPQSWFAWRDIMPALAEQHTVYAVDLPGLGDSQGSPSGYDKATLARYVHGLVAASSAWTTSGWPGTTSEPGSPSSTRRSSRRRSSGTPTWTTPCPARRSAPGSTRPSAGTWPSTTRRPSRRRSSTTTYGPTSRCSTPRSRSGV